MAWQAVAGAPRQQPTEDSMRQRDHYTPYDDDGALHQQSLDELQRKDHEEREERVSGILNAAVLRTLTFEEVNQVRDFCGL